MSTYIVGDIQACLDGLIKVLNEAGFRRGNDTLYAVGDLIGRGPHALETLEFLRSLGSAFQSTLGNHDLHFLAITQGHKTAKPKEGYQRLLKHPQLPSYIDWMRAQPLAIQLDANTLISHAGLYPKWSIAEANSLAQEIEQELRGDGFSKLLANMYGDSPSVWSGTLQGEEKQRFVVNALTRMRYLHSDGVNLDMNCKLPPIDAPKDLIPWFEIDNPNLTHQQRVFFGHWASLQGKTGKSNCVALDTGYIWGGPMSLFHLEKHQRISTK